MTMSKYKLIFFLFLLFTACQTEIEDTSVETPYTPNTRMV